MNSTRRFYDSLLNFPTAKRNSYLLSLDRPDREAVLEALKRETARRAELSKGDRYKDFRATYHDDPVAFLFDCVDWESIPNSTGPAPYQIEILGALPTKKRVSARGPHGLGKSTIEAWAILWFALVNDGLDWKAITTASAWRQLTVYLWPEIHKWSRALQWDVIGRPPLKDKVELLDRNIKLETGAASSVASSDHGKIEGAHAAKILFAYDEAKIIPDATWDASEGAFSTGDAYGLACSTPGIPLGRFYDIHSRKPGYEDWSVYHVTVDQAVEAGRISPEWVEQRRLQWGENSALFKNRVLGEFADEGTDGVIPLSWVEAAVERWHLWKEAGKPGLPETIGVDVGESGDYTVIAAKHAANVSSRSGNLSISIGYAIDDLAVHPKLDTMETVSKVVQFLERWRPEAPRITAFVDAIGIGSGVVSRLVELEKRAVAWIASHGSDKKDRAKILGFVNKRAEGWWGLREELDPRYEPTLALPPDDDLLGELVAPRYTERSGGKILVESKEEIRKRLGRSTDRADAVIMAVNGRPVTMDEKRSVSRRRNPERKRVW